jgi:hypothetical protein
MRKPNYRFERAERNRSKQAKKEEKLKRQQERLASRSDDSATAPAEDELPHEG